MTKTETCNIGDREQGGKFSIDIPTLIDTRMLICANSGAGKSYAVRKLVEESYGTVLSILIDLEGEFHTLREKYDFLLIGGTKGDVPLNLKSAKLLPQNILEQNVPSIIDLSELKKPDRITFVKDFLQALMELGREHYKPCLIVIDEAHQFAGQQEKQDSTWAVIDLMTRGRKRGYTGILCTQRISKLHKDAAAECNNVLVGRTFLDLDVNRASEILGFASKQDTLSIRNLTPGEFYAYGSAFNFKGIEKIKIGKASTTHPKVGMEIKAEISPPTPKIKALLTKITNLPQEAEREYKDKTEMQKRIRELEIQLKQRGFQQDPKALDKAKEEGFKRANIENLKINAEKDKLIKELQARLQSIGKILGTQIKMPEIRQSTLPSDPWRLKDLEKKTPVASAKEIAIDAEAREFGKGERAILQFLAMREGKDFSKSQVGAMTNYNPKGGTFNVYLSALRSAGLITMRGNRLSMNPEAASKIIEILGDEYNAPAKTSYEDWLNKLGAGEKKIYQYLLEHPSEEFTKEEIGAETGYDHQGGTFNVYLSKLCTLGLAEKIDGKIRLNQELLQI